MAIILSWKLALAAAALSGVVMSASANQAHPVITPALVGQGQVTAVRIIARAGRHHLKAHQKKRAANKKAMNKKATNKKEGGYPSEAGPSGAR